MWIYVQGTGELWRDGERIGIGYSGKGEAKNDPQAQGVHNQGPIPQGEYKIGVPVDSKVHGPLTLPLYPSMDNVMHGRSAFKIHGDSVSAPGTASEGCIVMPRTIRSLIASSGDTLLHVVPSLEV
jgi:hypothetical protein